MNYKYIYDTIGKVLIKHNRFTPNRFMLILNTGLAESGYKANNISKDSKGVGYWQLEFETVKDLLVNTVPNLPNPNGMYNDLLGMRDYYTKKRHKEICGIDPAVADFNFQIRMVDIKYRTDPEPLPDYTNIWQQGKYWKRIYNTIDGAGTVEHFVREVNFFNNERSL